MKFGFHFCSTALAFWIFVGHKTHNSGLVVCVAVVLRAWVCFFSPVWCLIRFLLVVGEMGSCKMGQKICQLPLPKRPLPGHVFCAKGKRGRKYTNNSIPDGTDVFHICSCFNRKPKRNEAHLLDTWCVLEHMLSICCLPFETRRWDETFQSLVRDVWGRSWVVLT